MLSGVPMGLIMKRLAIVLAAACLSATAARADTLLSYEIALDEFTSMTWERKVEFIGGKFKKECRRGAGCAKIMRFKEDSADLTLIETFATEYTPVTRIWCLKEVGSWRMHCENDPPIERMPLRP
jgi:hypothetical protein